MIVIPAYQPDKALLKTVSDLLKDKYGSVYSSQYPKILIVNDGSTSPESLRIFSVLAAMSGVELINHDKNMGKGAALKSAIKYAESKNVPFIVTADADGQHLPEDIIKIAKYDLDYNGLVLGVREFGKGVPFRSRLGNQVTKLVFRIFSGFWIADTQTGLRRIPNNLYKKYLKIPVNGYDFEFEALWQTARSGNINQIAINTVYEANNPSSHFRPLIDSAKIYFVFLRSIYVALCVTVLDITIFSISVGLGVSTFSAIITSRGIALVIYFYLARTFVFKSSGNKVVEFIKFLLLVLTNAVLLTPFIIYVSDSTGAAKTLSYMIGSLLLYLFNFILQKTVIFNRDNK